MIRTVLTLALAGALATPAEAQTVAQRIQAVTGGIPAAVEIQGAPPSRQSLEARMAALHVPGVAMAVIKGGKVEWSRGFGFTRQGGEAVTADTLFQAGSVSKPVAAMAALALVEDGRLSLDTDVNKTLKSWTLPASPFPTTTPVTLRALLSHTAGTTVHGFAGYKAGAPVPTLPQVLSGAAPANSDPVVVDQAVGGVLAQVVLPQVELELVVRPAAQEGHVFTVGRDFQAAHAGAGLHPAGVWHRTGLGDDPAPGEAAAGGPRPAGHPGPAGPAPGRPARHRLPGAARPACVRALAQPERGRRACCAGYRDGQPAACRSRRCPPRNRLTKEP